MLRGVSVETELSGTGPRSTPEGEDLSAPASDRTASRPGPALNVPLPSRPLGDSAVTASGPPAGTVGTMTPNPPPAHPDQESQAGPNQRPTGPPQAKPTQECADTLTDQTGALAVLAQERDQARDIARLLRRDLAAIERYVYRVRKLALPWVETEELRAQDVAELRDWPRTAHDWPFDEPRGETR